MPEQIRCFIAFDMSNNEVLRELRDAQNKLRNTGADLKIVKPENIHITMRFLGNILPDMVNRIYNEIEQVSFTPFDADIQNVGTFPTAKRPRVVWAGIQEGATELKAISNQIELRLQKLEFKRDARSFSPHITIARVRTGRNRVELIHCIEELKDYKFGAVRIECLRLKKSQLTPKGPIYSTLKEICR